MRFLYLLGKNPFWAVIGICLLYGSLSLYLNHQEPPTEELPITQGTDGKPRQGSTDSSLFMLQAAAKITETQLQLLKDSLRAVNQQLRQLAQQKPKKPLNTTNISPNLLFQIDFLPQDHPQLTGFDDIVFVTDTNRTPMQTVNENAQVIWEDGQLTRSNGIDDYALLLKKGDREVTIYGFPAFGGRSFGKAMRLFERELAKFQRKWRRLLRTKDRLDQRYQALYADWLAQLQKIRVKVKRVGVRRM